MPPGIYIRNKEMKTGKYKRTKAMKERRREAFFSNPNYQKFRHTQKHSEETIKLVKLSWTEERRKNQSLKMIASHARRKQNGK